MKRGKAEEGAVRAEYDFSKAVKNPYAERANRSTNLVVIDPDLFAVFPGGDEVNAALRLIVRASGKAVKRAKAS